MHTYIHNIHTYITGRCGRYGRRGIAINFVCDERSRDNLKYIIDTLGCKITPVPIDDEEEIEEALKF